MQPTICRAARLYSSVSTTRYAWQCCTEAISNRLRNWQYSKFAMHPGSANIRYHAHQAASPTPSPPVSFPDPSRPDLYYHLINPPNPISHVLPAFALSFLPFPPTHTKSSTVIGWLPAQVYEKTDGASKRTGTGVKTEGCKDTQRSNEEDAALQDFRENSNFLRFLHEMIKNELEEKANTIQTDGVGESTDGWLHIHDQRSVPIVGPIGDPEDIIASVLMRKSTILPETYQPVPSYRLVTTYGVMKLTPELAGRLHSALLQLALTEKATAVRETAWNAHNVQGVGSP
ncbi:hypothetical protein BDQ12DRAFT_694266 [Crucibulum laeve]|uniref:Uncharacterized protein n=1 Tax=Crucibulum laeve TaxID=68775 RepID=A0A5C3LE69_9AGAR|nr:hypothetical protein BDQ12DRAFT_694266 [Crucibulum laeve]